MLQHQHGVTQLELLVALDASSPPCSVMGKPSTLESIFGKQPQEQELLYCAVRQGLLELDAKFGLAPPLPRNSASTDYYISSHTLLLTTYETLISPPLGALLHVSRRIGFG